jgi:hypothetical protein
VIHATGLKKFDGDSKIITIITMTRVLWHGLLTVPLPPTEGLPEPVALPTGSRILSVSSRNTVT